MTTKMKFKDHFAAAVLALLWVSCSHAQNYPSQPIRIIVPMSPGGVTDIAARILSQRIGEVGKVGIVENRTGGGGTIGAEFAARAAPDGYTVLVGLHNTHSILPHLQKVPYDRDKDFVPVTIAVQSTNILVINPAIPAKSLSELIAYAKANPGKLTFASQGMGSTGHLFGEQLKHLAGIDITHVPYRGTGPAVQDVIAGQVSMVFDAMTTARPQIRAGHVRALAIASAQRDPLVPEVPTAAELGFPQIQGKAWFGFFVPAKTPPDVVDWLYTRAKEAFTREESRARLAQQGISVLLGTPAETAVFVEDDYNHWGAVIKEANIRLGR